VRAPYRGKASSLKRKRRRGAPNLKSPPTREGQAEVKGRKESFAAHSGSKEEDWSSRNLNSKKKRKKFRGSMKREGSFAKKAMGGGGTKPRVK